MALERESISVFDMLKIGVGPSSSHTLGPWRAAERFIEHLKSLNLLQETKEVHVDLYGSLSLTGKGHATDLAIMLGLSGADPEYTPIEDIQPIIDAINKEHILKLDAQHQITFLPQTHLQFHKKFLPFHANGLRFHAILAIWQKEI